MFLFVVRLLRSLVADAEDEEKNSLILFCFQKMNDACMYMCTDNDLFIQYIAIQYNSKCRLFEYTMPPSNLKADVCVNYIASYKSEHIKLKI